MSFFKATSWRPASALIVLALAVTALSAGGRGTALAGAVTVTPAKSNGAIDIAAGTDRIWGDVDCKNGLGPPDALKILQTDAGYTVPQTVTGCPALGSNVTVNGNTWAWGDVDCKNGLGPPDALKLLQTDAGYTVPQTVTGCPALGSTVTLGAGSSPTPTPSPSPSPTPNSFASFGDGTWRVGSDIPPGLYRNSDSSGDCYWARLSGFGGTLAEIIANNIDTSIQTVQIKPGDIGFTSDRCGTWSQDLIAPSSGPSQPFGSGAWIVGTEITPGLWRNSDSSGSCYWARLSGFGGTLNEIIANYFGSSIQTVQINPGDVGFTSDRCGTWSQDLIAPSPTSTATSTATVTPTPTPTPTAAATPTPTPTSSADCHDVPSNPWNYDFCTPGNFISDTPSDFCSYFDCIASFADGTGYVAQCNDLKFSRSGGNVGACSQHGDVKRALYSH